jgi:predicted dehydrogenase
MSRSAWDARCPCRSPEIAHPAQPSPFITMPRIAFLSTAHIHTKGFIENILKATDGRSVAAVWDDIADRGQRYAQLAGAPYVAELEAVLRDPAIDGFIICAENTRHLPLLRCVLPLGKPVFCEKPLCTNVTELREIAALLREHPATPLFCGYFQPFAGEMQAAADLLNRGAFGQVTRIRYRNAHHAAYGRWFDNPDLAWFYQPELSGGGAFVDMGTHAVHLVRTLFGPVRRVWATIGNHSGIYPTADDFGIAHFEFASGVLGTVEAAWTQTGGLGGLEIVGSGGAFWHNGQTYLTGSPNQPAAPVQGLPGKLTRVDRLVAIVRGQIPAAELAADLAATLDAVAIMSACYASAASGQWTPVETV